MNNAIISNSKGVVCLKKDNIQGQLQAALPNFKVLAGGYVEYYNVSYHKDNTQHHLAFYFSTAQQAKECANYLTFSYGLDYQVTKDRLSVSFHDVGDFRQQAKQTLKKLANYRIKDRLLKSVNYANGWYEYYVLCYDIANYKNFRLLSFTTLEQATQAKQLLAQLGQPTPFYIIKHQVPLYSLDQAYCQGTVKQFYSLKQFIQQSEQQLHRLKIFARSIEAKTMAHIPYTEVIYYTLNLNIATNNTNTSLYVFEQREQAQQCASLLSQSSTTTENYGYHYRVVVATACLTGDMEKAFKQCKQLSLTSLNKLQQSFIANNNQVVSHD